MQIEYRAVSLNLVTDALSRFNEENVTEAISAISEGEKTSDTWYNRMFKQVGNDTNCNLIRGAEGKKIRYF